MLKKIANQKLVKNEHGITLIELLSVIVILAIISAIAIPAVGNIIINARYNAVKEDAIHVLNAANMYFVEHDTETKVYVETLLDENYLESAGLIPIHHTSFVRKDEQNRLNTGIIFYMYSIEKGVVFEEATISDINYDKSKGTDDGGIVIGSRK